MEWASIIQDTNTHTQTQTQSCTLSHIKTDGCDLHMCIFSILLLRYLIHIYAAYHILILCCMYFTVVIFHRIAVTHRHEHTHTHSHHFPQYQSLLLLLLLRFHYFYIVCIVVALSMMLCISDTHGPRAQRGEVGSRPIPFYLVYRGTIFFYLSNVLPLPGQHFQKSIPSSVHFPNKLHKRKEMELKYQWTI